MRGVRHMTRRWLHPLRLAACLLLVQATHQSSALRDASLATEARTLTGITSSPSTSSDSDTSIRHSDSSSGSGSSSSSSSVVGAARRLTDDSASDSNHSSAAVAVSNVAVSNVAVPSGGPLSRPAGPMVDVVVSFRSVRRSRDFWIGFLEFWPPDVGDLYIVVDHQFGNTTEWRDFQRCLSAAPGYTPRFAVLQAEIRHTKNQQDLFWRTAAFTKNHWKFFLDSVVPKSGPDRVIAVIDDDSCFIDHFVLDDIVDRSTGKVVARGILQKDQTWARWIHDIGLPWVGNFMTDFPVFWWRDMLPDMREWMIRKASGRPPSEDTAVMRDQFWRAYQKLFRETPGGHSCEYCILLNFAHASDKWRGRYDWRVAPHRISMGMSLHQHTCGCPRKQELAASGLRDVLLFYPYALRTRFLKHKFASYDWWWREFISAPFQEHWKRGPVASNKTGVRNMGSDLNTKERFSTNPNKTARFNHSMWAAYEKGGNREPWRAMLRAHDANLRRWRTGRDGEDQGEGADAPAAAAAAADGAASAATAAPASPSTSGSAVRAMSHVELEPNILRAWETCFAVPDNACFHKARPLPAAPGAGAGDGGLLLAPVPEAPPPPPRPRPANHHDRRKRVRGGCNERRDGSCGEDIPGVGVVRSSTGGEGQYGEGMGEGESVQRAAARP